MSRQETKKIFKRNKKMLTKETRYDIILKLLEKRGQSSRKKNFKKNSKSFKKELTSKTKYVIILKLLQEATNKKKFFEN